MTIKEFQRRMVFYRELELACQLFHDGTHPKFIYSVKFSWIGRKTSTYVKYPSQFCFGESFVSECEYLWFDRFTYTDFNVQLRYFKSFFNRCSKSQKEILRSSGFYSSLFTVLAADDCSE